MNDHQLQHFESWLKEELFALAPLDDDFSQQVIAKIETAQFQTTQLEAVASQRTTERWNMVSLLVCMVAFGTLLIQSLSQIDTLLLSGPILESLLLLVAMMAVSWQFQTNWHEGL
jgi:hypothetical protein